MKIFFEQKQRDQDKRNKIFFQNGVENKENSEMFVEDLAWRTNLQEKLITKRRKAMSFFKKKNQRYFFCKFSKKKKLNDNFWRDPKKKIDERKSRKVISKNATI